MDIGKVRVAIMKMIFPQKKNKKTSLTINVFSVNFVQRGNEEKKRKILLLIIRFSIQLLAALLLA